MQAGSGLCDGAVGGGGVGGCSHLLLAVAAANCAEIQTSYWQICSELVDDVVRSPQN